MGRYNTAPAISCYATKYKKATIGSDFEAEFLLHLEISVSTAEMY